MFLMLGASRCYAIDLDQPKNSGRALKALADLAGTMLIDPSSIIRDYPISREEMLANLKGFDLAKLRNGDASGLDSDRLVFKIDNADELPLNDGEADIVTSNAFLEHLTNPDKVLTEIARITKEGGFGTHVVDATDHRRYNDPSIHALAYLKEPGGEVSRFSYKDQVTYHMNRIRPWQFTEYWQRNGFEVSACNTILSTEVTKAMQDEFIEPYRSMNMDLLRDLIVSFVVRRHG